MLQRDLQETVDSDPAGRFELRTLEAGPTRLVVVIESSDADGRPPWFATNTLEL
ncbi:hypothetical protein [Solicola gregarius]|uniref:Uncharacterized protein n=1 Tax=Solicola gregarius TaxID=2908642 RepID=A0AA46TH36_9ACTN|nr:hypothetical protein [Solicola gregarius]UYM05073.1 hypothetical protein L0C25_21540 [Solicola gregarius]